MIQDTIAKMAAEIMAIRWQVYYAAELKSKGLPHAKELSAAKMLASELAVKASSQAVRVHGAYGSARTITPWPIITAMRSSPRSSAARLKCTN